MALELLESEKGHMWIRLAKSDPSHSNLAEMQSLTHILSGLLRQSRYRRATRRPWIWNTVILMQGAGCMTQDAGCNAYMHDCVVVAV
jgi:hypothetical protein